MAPLPIGLEEPGNVRDIRLGVATIPSLAWSAGPDGSADFFNQRWLDYTGLSAKQALGSGWAVAIHPEDLPRILETFREALNSVKPYEVEGRFRRFDGEFRWFLFRGSPLRDRSGKVAKWYGTNTDLEERKRAEEALRKSEERWRSVFENSAIGVAVTDLNARYLATNNVYQTIVGYTDEELRALDFLTVTHEDYREANWALVTELVEGKRRQFQIEKKYRRKEGSLVWVSNNVSLVPGTERVPRFIMALSEDITERKRAEDTLRASEASCLDAQRLTRTWCWRHEVLTGKMTVTPEGLAVNGIEPEDDASSADFYFRRMHPKDRPEVEQAYAAALLRKTDFEADFRIVLPDGTIKNTRSIGHPILDERGDVVEFVGASIDVTEHHRAAQALRRSEAYLAEAQRLAKTGSWAYNPGAEKAIYWSDEMLRMFGLDPQRSNFPNGEEFLRMMHPEDRDRFNELYERSRIQKTDYDADYRIVLPDGAIKHLHVVHHPVLNESGDLVEFVGTAIDVTAAKQAEEKIRQSESELRQILELAPQHVYVLRPDPDRTLLYANRAALDYLGLAFEEWRAFHRRSLSRPEDWGRWMGQAQDKVSSGLPQETRQL